MLTFALKLKPSCGTGVAEVLSTGKKNDVRGGRAATASYAAKVKKSPEKSMTHPVTGKQKT
jgi:hypothetical protein